MLVIGIAGGSGTGKSTIAAHVARRFGGTHVDGDRVAHAVLEDPAVVDAIRREFGDDVVEADGGVNRRRLGTRVFPDAGKRAALNAIVHPAVLARFSSEVDAARARGDRVLVIDAALLLEVEVDFRYDLLLALTCDRETRRHRIMAKGGWTDAEIRARLDAQEGMEKHFYKAHAVVNTGPELPDVLQDVERRVETALAAENDA